MAGTRRTETLGLAVLAGAVCVVAALLFRRASGLARAEESAMLDESLEESFPASDPPAFTPAALPH